jgi:hypothetical protein
MEAALPSQNELYALYIKTCCSLGIRKPNKHIVDLLAEDSYSRRRRLEREATALQVHPSVLEADAEVEDTAVQPVSTLEELPDMVRCGHLGAKGVIALLTSIVKECPLLQRLDLSALPNLFHADPYKQSPTGNQVIEVICNVAAAHPSLNTLHFGAHRLGTAAGQMLLEAVQRNPQLVTVTYSPDTMHPTVHTQLQQALSNNRKGANASGVVPPMPLGLSDAVKQVAFVDRKTSDQRQLLSNLLADLLTSIPSRGVASNDGDELPVALRRSADLPPTLPPATLARIVDESAPITLHEMIPQINSLRGDGSNLFLVARGELTVVFGGPNRPLLLRKGDFFGEPLHSPLYAAGSMEVSERGLAFRIPLSLVEPLTTHWSQRVEDFMPLVRQVPLLQPLHAWSLTRICMCSATHRCTESSPPLFTCQEEFGGVYVVVGGTVRLAIPADRPITPNGDSDGLPQEGALVAVGGWSATPLDLFGFEAAFSTHRLSPVSATPCAEAVCLQVGLHVSDSHVITPLRESLIVEARSKMKEAKSVVTNT